MTTDTTNPKDAIGNLKIPLDIFPTTALIAGSLGILEGKLKYGRTNWRSTPVRASIYMDACKRHLSAWTEGQEVDPITLVPHMGSAIACIAIVIDAKAHGTLIDDRVYPSDGYFNMAAELTPVVAHLQELFSDKNPIQYTREYAEQEEVKRQIYAAQNIHEMHSKLFPGAKRKGPAKSTRIKRAVKSLRAKKK